MDLTNLSIALMQAKNDGHITTVTPLLKHFISHIQILDKHAIKRFQRKERKALFAIYSDCKYILQKFHTLREFRSLFDKAFKLLPDVKPLGLKNITTTLFDAFVYGITRIEKIHDNDDTPSYHRQQSCSSRSLWKHGDNHICFIDLNSDQLKNRKKRILTCYLERMIYNEIFTHTQPCIPFEMAPDMHVNTIQDHGHAQMLEESKRVFDTCFPNTHIEIQFGSNSQGIPVILQVLTFTKRGRVLQTIDTYIKTTKPMNDFDMLFEDVYNRGTIQYKQIISSNKFKSRGLILDNNKIHVGKWDAPIENHLHMFQQHISGFQGVDVSGVLHPTNPSHELLISNHS